MPHQPPISLPPLARG
uniref:Uncharacterized protein n=1 Tax=Anopheles quadriannulatus TaxID=34691 RepID=A0A182XQW0_ANOQN